MSSGYDAIVVGAGSAGCVVASRLAADRARSILLLEAGPDPEASVTPLMRNGWLLPRGDGWPFDWGYTAEPDAAGAEAPIRRGRVVGGTSWLTRFAVRGARADFDAWAARGLDGWSFDDVLPAFCRVERDLEFGDRPWHGDAGPVPVTRYPNIARHPMHQATFEALVAAGFKPIEDVNAPDALGVGPMPMSQADGRRTSSVDAFLPAAGRPENLEVRAGSLVAAVPLDAGRATGVRLANGQLVEGDLVILCAGTYGSPTLLQRSGIGPADVLRSLGIPVAVDLPGVGGNLADHPGLEVVVGWSGETRTEPQVHSIATWRSASCGAAESPDLLYWVADPAGDPPTMSIECVLMRPEARGTVRIRSADAKDPPRISLPDIRHRADVARLREAWRRAIEIANRPEARGVAGPTADPSPAKDDQWPAFVLENGYHVPHVVGTCAMAMSPAEGAVVDAQGRVRGVDALRVVDASIIPEPPSGFPNLVTMMLAEHISSKVGQT